MFFVGWFVGSALGIVTTVIVASITSSNRDLKYEEVQEEETKVTHEKSEVPCQINSVNAEEIRGVKSMDHLIQQVEEWARVRKLDTADPKAQTLKVVEEITEMMTAYESYDYEGVVDGIGDTCVTLIILSQQLGMEFRGITEEREDSVYELRWAMIYEERELAKRMYAILNNLTSGVSKNNKMLISEGIDGALEIVASIARKTLKGTVAQAVEYCLYTAYSEIKDRKGMVVSGTFVKYDDLSSEQKAVLDNARV